MKQQIKISVAGLTASGKSTVINVIQNALEEKGIRTKVVESDSLPPLRSIKERIEYVATSSKKSPITIHEVYARRDHHGEVV